MMARKTISIGIFLFLCSLITMAILYVGKVVDMTGLI